MLEITLARDDGTSFAFQFENDALQTYLANAMAEKKGCRIVQLTALGSGKFITHELPPAEKKATLSKPAVDPQDAKSVEAQKPAARPAPAAKPDTPPAPAQTPPKK